MVNRLQAVRRLPNYLFARLPECNLKFRQFTLSCKMHSTSQTPELFAETAGGTGITLVSPNAPCLTLTIR